MASPPMASSPPLPVVVGGQVRQGTSSPTRMYNNPNSILNGYPYEFSVVLDIIALPNLDQGAVGGTQFGAANIRVGQWLLQITGCAYLIVAIEPAVSDTITLTIRDVDMYNALTDQTQQGTNYPTEATPIIIFSLSEEGVPIITNAVILGLAGSWLNDALGRFTYRNFIQTYYNFDINNSTIDYSTYQVGQIVYIGKVGGTGPYCFIPIDNSNPAHVAKSFGLVTSVNEPELGNIYVRPFGKVITTLPVTLSNANIGDVLYYDSTNANGNYTTNVAPAQNPIPIYIKISDNVVSVLYGSIASGGSGGGGGGVGVPPGGTTGQILAKIDGTNYNTTWVNPSVGGGGGGNIIYNDPWIQTNFIDPPPGLVFQTISATTTQIFVPWTNPTQSPIGLVTSYIPVINSLWANTKVQVPTNSNITLLSNATTPYINSNGTPNISGIVFSKLAGTSGFESNVAFPSPLAARNAYVYYNTSLANIVPGSSNTISIWYRNTNSNSNVATAILSTFLQAGQPSAPRSLALSNATGTTGTFTYIAPQFVDSTDTSSLLTINLYTITYDSPGSTNRYGGPIAHSLVTLTNSTNLSYNLTSLYPDSLYTLRVNARNSANISGQYASTTATTSTMATVPALSGTLPFPARYYTGVNIQSGSNTTALLNTNTNWTSLAISTPINAIANRGLLGGSNSTLMYISTTLTLGNTSTIGPAIGFTGYPISIPASSLASNITLSPTTVLDTYSSGATNQQGFFLHSVDTITLNSNIFIASASTYTVTANQSGSVSGSATMSFQYDGDPGTPSGSMSFNFNGSNYAPVSGVNIIYGSPTFQVTTTASNLGTYFYKSPILQYTGTPAWTPSNETNLTNIISGNSGSNFTNPVVFKRSISTNLATSYQSTIGLSGTIYNVATSNSISLTTISAIVDGPSYSLVYSTLPQTIPTVSNTGSLVIGYRVTSAVAGATNVPPFVDSNSNSYASTPYNNSLNIASLQELQVSNGKFTTPSASLLSYKDYTGFYYDASNNNIANYSLISNETGYRYATFAWKLASTGTGNYNSLMFTINTTKTIVITGGLAYVGSSPIRLYYRFENNASKIPTDLTNPLTSAWINGNSQTGTEANATTYVTPTLYTNTPTWGLLGTIHASNEFPVYIPPIQVTNQIVYLYCRIGIPMNEDFSFSYVSCKMT